MAKSDADADSINTREQQQPQQHQQRGSNKKKQKKKLAYLAVRVRVRFVLLLLQIEKCQKSRSRSWSWSWSSICDGPTVPPRPASSFATACPLSTATTYGAIAHLPAESSCTPSPTLHHTPHHFPPLARQLIPLSYAGWSQARIQRAWSTLSALVTAKNVEANQIAPSRRISIPLSPCHPPLSLAYQPKNSI